VCACFYVCERTRARCAGMRCSILHPCLSPSLVHPCCRVHMLRQRRHQQPSDNPTLSQMPSTPPHQKPLRLFLQALVSQSHPPSQRVLSPWACNLRQNIQISFSSETDSCSTGGQSRIQPRQIQLVQGRHSPPCCPFPSTSPAGSVPRASC